MPKTSQPHLSLPDFRLKITPKEADKAAELIRSPERYLTLYTEFKNIPGMIGVVTSANDTRNKGNFPTLGGARIRTISELISPAFITSIDNSTKRAAAQKLISLFRKSKEQLAKLEIKQQLDLLALAKQAAERESRFLAASMSEKYVTLAAGQAGIADEAIFLPGEREESIGLGGKSVLIAENLNFFQKGHEGFSTGQQRENLFKQHGQHTAAYFKKTKIRHTTAEDMRVTPEDLNQVASAVKKAGYPDLVACQTIAAGGTGNPSLATAEGVVAGIEALLDSDKNPYADKELAIGIQGLGNVGSGVAKNLIKDFASGKIFCKKLLLYLTDIDKGRAESLQKELLTDMQQSGINKDSVKFVIIYRANPKDRVPHEFISRPMDIFAPCAVPEILSKKVLAELNLRCRYICGAANNPWELDNLGVANLDTIKAYFKKNVNVSPFPMTNLGGIFHLEIGRAALAAGRPLDEAFQNRAGQLTRKTVYYLLTKMYAMSKKTKKPMEILYTDWVNHMAACMFKAKGAESLSLA